MKFETKLNKILTMEDSNLKLSKLNSLGLQFGVFDKERVITECQRLRNLGYKDLALIYLNSKQN
jgi:hypothetical protein